MARLNPFDRLHAAAEDGRLPSWLHAPASLGRRQLPRMARVPAREVPARPVRRATVSVVIPCYNYARYLPTCIESVLGQADVDVEVIVVDDASTDGSAALARALAEQQPRVRVLAQAVNSGPVATFNRGLDAATGEFVVRLDADDELTAGALARAVALFDAFPSVGLVYGHPLHFSTPRPSRRRSALRGWTVWSGHDWLRYRCTLGVNCITSPEVVMRHDVVRRVGGQRELDQTHDMEMWMRLAAASDIGHLDGAVQAAHREHAASRSAIMVNPMVDIAERCAAFDLLFDSVADLVPDAMRLHDQVRRTLANEALLRARRVYERQDPDTHDADELAEFAIKTYADTYQLRAWRLYELRRDATPSAAHRVRYQALAAMRRARTEYRYLRWLRTGI